MGKGFLGGLFGKKKSKNNKQEQPQNTAKAPSPSPATPQIKSVQGSSASANVSQNQPILNPITQSSPDDFDDETSEDLRNDSDRSSYSRDDHLDTDERTVDEDDVSMDGDRRNYSDNVDEHSGSYSSRSHSGSYSSGSRSGSYSGDEQQEDDMMGEDQGVFAALGGSEDEQDSTKRIMSHEEAAEYYGYGDAPPSYAQGFGESEDEVHGRSSDGHGSAENDERVISTDDSSVDGGGTVDGTPDSEAAAFYGYEDAAPTSSSNNLMALLDEEHDPSKSDTSKDDNGIRNENEEIHSSSPQQADPGETPADPSAADSELSQAAKLYLAKRHRLKQRRISMTPIEARTERAAARRNKLLLKKLLKKEMSEEDDYIQTHLGCDDKGKCLRHPNMTIVGKVTEFRFESVFSCKICASEQKAGGHARQRKSMSMVIGDIKSMQKDRRSWRLRTKVMHHGKEYNSDEDSDDQENKSDSSQSLDSLEKITAFFAEDADAQDLERRDDAWKENVSGRVAQVRGWDGKAALKCNPVFAKYFRMVALGVPPDAVKQACEFDGWDPRVMDLDPNRPLLDQLYSTKTWKKSEKEDLLLNIRLCMGQETTQEEAGDSLIQITDNIFEAYCKKKESIELHREEEKRQEEAQKWIGSGATLLKRTSSRRPETPQEQANEKKEDASKSDGGVAKSRPSTFSRKLNKSLSSKGGNGEEKESNTKDTSVGGMEPQQLDGFSTLSSDINQTLGGIAEGEEDSESNFYDETPTAVQPTIATEPPILEEAENKRDNVENDASATDSEKNSAEVGLDESKPALPPSESLEQPEDARPTATEMVDIRDETEGENDCYGSDDEEELELPLEEPGQGKIGDDLIAERRKSIDSDSNYSVADDGAETEDEMDHELKMDGDDGVADDEMDQDVLKMAFESTGSLSSIGEIFDDLTVDGEDDVEGQNDIPTSTEEKPSPVIDNLSVSVKSDMTGESLKKSEWSNNKQTSGQKDIETALLLLEKKDIIVGSLVAKVERLRQELADQNKVPNGGERTLAEELRETKRLLAEKQVIATGLEKHIQRQEYEANEKLQIVSQQTMEILRLKEKIANECPGAPEADSEKASARRSSTSRKSKTSSSSDKKKSSSSRSSKDSKSHKSESSKNPRKENLDRAHLRAVFKKTVRKLIIITRSFQQSLPVDKEMSVDRKSFRRSSTRMDGFVVPTDWNEFLSDDDEDLDSKPPRPPQKSASLEPVRARGEMLAQQRGAASVLLSSKDARIPGRRIQWHDDDNICKVIFIDCIPAELKKELFYNGEDIQKFRLDKFMEDHEDEFELVDEDASDYSEEWIEEEFSETEIEYVDEEGSYIEEEIVTDGEYSIEEANAAQPTRRRSLF